MKLNQNVDSGMPESISWWGEMEDSFYEVEKNNTDRKFREGQCLNIDVGIASSL